MNVELIYERTCPNIEAARTRLIQAFHRARLSATWCEWEMSALETPEYARQYGSPTILIDSKDVSGDGHQASSNICREASTPSPARGLGLAALPSVGVALLPKLTCPFCWPAYTALLSSVGISFVDYTPYLLPTIAVFLAITLWALAYRAPAQRGYGPFWLGVLGAVNVVTGKFIIESELMLYFGVGLLVDK